MNAIPPLTRFMLDAVPDGSESGTDANPNTVEASVDSSAASPASGSLDSDVPVAVGSSPVQEDSAVESSAAVSAIESSVTESAAPSAVAALVRQA